LNLSFETPGILYLLVIVPLLLPFVIIRYRRNRDKAALFASAAPSDERAALLKELRFRILVSEFFFLVFLALLVAAFAGPRWGLRRVNDYSRDIDLVMAFDLSRSMNVEDCAKAQHSEEGALSRLERGRQIALELARSLDGIRVGVAIGKGRGVLAVPLTYDTETVINFLEALDGGAITGAGTNLESLVDAAAGAFQASIPSRRVVLVFSDGEGLDGSFQAAVDRAARASIAVSSVGLGSYQGGLVPGLEPPVMSARHDDLLRAGAALSGGVYVDCALDDAAAILLNHINAILFESRLQAQRWEPYPRFGLFVFAALAALLVSRAMGYRYSKEKGKGKRDQGPGTREPLVRTERLLPTRSDCKQLSPVPSPQSPVPFFLLLLLLSLSACRETRGKLLIMEANSLTARGRYTEAITVYLRAREYGEAAPYAEYGLASVFFALDEGEAALERYNAAAAALRVQAEGQNELAFRVHYNSGIIHFENGDYAAAAAAFR